MKACLAVGLFFLGVFLGTSWAHATGPGYSTVDFTPLCVDTKGRIIFLSSESNDCNGSYNCLGFSRNYAIYDPLAALNGQGNPWSSQAIISLQNRPWEFNLKDDAINLALPGAGIACKRMAFLENNLYPRVFSYVVPGFCDEGDRNALLISTSGFEEVIMPRGDMESFPWFISGSLVCSRITRKTSIAWENNPVRYRIPRPIQFEIVVGDQTVLGFNAISALAEEEGTLIDGEAMDYDVIVVQVPTDLLKKYKLKLIHRAAQAAAEDPESPTREAIQKWPYMPNQEGPVALWYRYALMLDPEDQTARLAYVRELASSELFAEAYKPAAVVGHLKKIVSLKGLKNFLKIEKAFDGIRQSPEFRSFYNSLPEGPGAAPEKKAPAPPDPKVRKQLN